jgi:hypothetical protein
VLKKQTLKHVAGDELAFLEQLIEILELRSEAQRKQGKLVEAADNMQGTRFL